MSNPVRKRRIILTLALALISFTIILKSPVPPAASASPIQDAPIQLIDPNAQSSGWFGSSIAVGERGGHTLVAVGAPLEGPSPSAIGVPPGPAGHACTFFASNGNLNLCSESDNMEPGEFGFSVSLSGGVLAIGAPGEFVSPPVGNTVDNAGNAYFGDPFFISNTPPPRPSYVVNSPSPEVGGEFGFSVATSGGLMVVGADHETVGSLLRAGHAYVFSSFSQIPPPPCQSTPSQCLQFPLTSPNPEMGGDFGYSVAVGGGLVVVGAPDESAGGRPGAGNVYVFSASTGNLLFPLSSPNPEAAGSFGISVVVGAGVVVVGADHETAGGQASAGRVYVFNAVTGGLLFTLTSPNAQFGGVFGASVAVSDGLIVVGAPIETAAVQGGQGMAGNAYVFSGSNGQPLHTLTSPNQQLHGQFGTSVGVDGGVVAVGARFETQNGQPMAGNAYVFITGCNCLHIAEFFTDASLNSLTSVGVNFARGIISSVNPGQVIAWVNITNTSGSSLQSLELNDTLPADWVVSPAWIPALGAIHVFYANGTSLANETDITQPSTIHVSRGNPQVVVMTISNLTATPIGHPLMAGKSILLSVKLAYGLVKTAQTLASYPRNYTDSASTTTWTLVSFTGTNFTGNGSALFTADTKVVRS